LRKYRNHATENVTLAQTPRITQEEAEVLAEFDLGTRRTRIVQDYNERVDNINQNAIARRIQTSSIVMQQLERAMERKLDALERLDDMKARLAKRILTDNHRVTLATERERAISRSRSLRDYVAVRRMRLSVPFNEQELINEELYTAYLAWLLQFPIDVALGIFNHNRIFLNNMGITLWTRMLGELSQRETIGQ